MNSYSISTAFALALVGCAAAPDLPPNYALDAGRGEGLAVVSLSLSGKAFERITEFEYRLREIPPRDEEAVRKSIRFGSPIQHARSQEHSDDGRKVAGKAVVKGSDLREPLDIHDAGKPVGRLLTLRLPAGEYEFHAWRLTEPGPYGEVEYAPKKDFSYRFSVKSGATSYLGRLHLQLGERDSQKLRLRIAATVTWPHSAANIPGSTAWQ